MPLITVRGQHFKPDTYNKTLLPSDSKSRIELLADYNPYSPTTKVKYLVAYTFA
jgi:hypothetical protein